MKLKNWNKTVSIQVAKTGWILLIPNEIPEIYVRWEFLVNRLKEELTQSGGS
jgi:hypothetical protein